MSDYIVLSRDHHDVSGTDSPFRETSNIYDGSAFTAGWKAISFINHPKKFDSFVLLLSANNTTHSSRRYGRSELHRWFVSRCNLGVPAQWRWGRLGRSDKWYLQFLKKTFSLVFKVMNFLHVHRRIWIGAGRFGWSSPACWKYAQLGCI